MHGVRRQATQPSAEARQQRKAKEASKLQAYLDVEKAFFAAKQAKDHSESSLELTSQLLSLNPELYTAWNFRREVLTSLFECGSSEGEAMKDIFASLRIDEEKPSTKSGNAEHKRTLLYQDIELTEHALRAHPKVYWIWNHRAWCLQQLPDDQEEQEREATEGESEENVIERRGSKWRREMKLADKMLELDPRNFHGWAYRRSLLASLAASFSSASLPPFPHSLASPNLAGALLSAHITLAEKELAYTLRKIEANFSNFSAWHQRSLVLPLLWRAKGWEEKRKSLEIDKELDLVSQAMYTDPSDQSVWLYHQWLVDQDPTPSRLDKEMKLIEELLELEPDAKWAPMNLARYQLLRASQLSEDAYASSRLRSSAMAHMRSAMDSDPDRRGMYSDLLAAGEA